MRLPTLIASALLLALIATPPAGALAAASTPASSRPAARLAMTPEESLWYTRLDAAMIASQNLANNTMRSNDLYSIGRDGGNYVEALIMAWRATGENRYIDRVYELTQMARDSLRDRWLDGTTDGFTDWQWLIDPTNATYYGNDLNWLDESITSGNVALWMWLFHINRDADPRYAEAADFWRSWLENQFLAKWYQRAGGNPLVAWNTPYAAFYKPDCEPRSANWRLAWYLWKVTGNTFYRDRAEEIRVQLVNANVTNPAHPLAYRWAKELDPATANWQACNYANYYMRVVLEMSLEGVPFFSSPTQMKRFAATFRDVVYANTNSRTTMPNDVNGGGSTAYALYAFNGFSPWDSTGFLMTLAGQSITGAGNYAGGGLSKAARNDVFMSSYALMALAPMGSTATRVIAFSGQFLGNGSVSVQWELSAPDAAANVYRVSADGIQRTLVNPTPITGPGSHVLVDTTPLAGSSLTYELDEVTGNGEGRLAQINVAHPSAGVGGGPSVTLEPARPNPFASTMLITFVVPSAGRVTLDVLDLSGRVLRVLQDGDLSAGTQMREWDGRDDSGHTVPAGTYFYRVRSSAGTAVRRAIRVP
jgi:hypothetical protein